MIIDEMHRRMAVTADIRLKQREIDVLAVPYNSSAEVWDPIEGRRYSESISPDAFRVQKRRPNQVKILRDHDMHRLIGSCRSVHPNRPDGLHATMRVANTPLGDESLALAEDGALHVSVGFIPDFGHDEWTQDRTAVVRHACDLWEISLVPFPAYEEAEVLAVRRAPQLGDGPAVVVVVDGTPRKDAILAKLAEIGYSPDL